MSTSTRRSLRKERTGFATRRDGRAALHEQEIAEAGTSRAELAEACRFLRSALARMGKRRGQQAAALLLSRAEARRIADLAQAVERGDHDAGR